MDSRDENPKEDAGEDIIEQKRDAQLPPPQSEQSRGPKPLPSPNKVRDIPAVVPTLTPKHRRDATAKPRIVKKPPSIVSKAVPKGGTLPPPYFAKKTNSNDEPSTAKLPALAERKPVAPNIPLTVAIDGHVDDNEFSERQTTAAMMGEDTLTSVAIYDEKTVAPNANEFVKEVERSVATLTETSGEDVDTDSKDPDANSSTNSVINVLRREMMFIKKRITKLRGEIDVLGRQQDKLGVDVGELQEGRATAEFPSRSEPTAGRLEDRALIDSLLAFAQGAREELDFLRDQYSAIDVGSRSSIERSEISTIESDLHEVRQWVRALQTAEARTRLSDVEVAVEGLRERVSIFAEDEHHTKDEIASRVEDLESLDGARTKQEVFDLQAIVGDMRNAVDGLLSGDAIPLGNVSEFSELKDDLDTLRGEIQRGGFEQKQNVDAEISRLRDEMHALIDQRTSSKRTQEDAALDEIRCELDALRIQQQSMLESRVFDVAEEALRAELSALRSDMNATYQESSESAQHLHDMLRDQLQTLQEEHEVLRGEELGAARQVSRKLQDDIAQLQKSREEFENHVATLNPAAEISELKDEIKILQRELYEAKGREDALVIKHAEMMARSDSLQTNIERLQEENAALSANVARQQEMESLLLRQQTRFDELANEVAQLQLKAKPEKKSTKKSRAEERQSSAAHIPAHDDLTKLKGIGPKYAKALHAADVTSFAQIAGWTKADLAEISPRIGVSVERIETLGWRKQAKSLAKKR